MADITAIILAGNEEVHIGRAIVCLQRICQRVVVVDSYSTDSTVQIARELGAEIYQNSWINYADQFRWALENCAIDTEWIMRFDADECFEADLIDEINSRLPKLPLEITGINLRRRHYFMGDWVRYGGRYPLILLRIWRREAAKIEQRWMDEHIYLLRGSALTFENDFADKSLFDAVQWTNKHVGYADREAVDVLLQKHGIGLSCESISQHGGSFQARLKRWFKERLYNRLPFLMGPLFYFLYRYIIQRGLFDNQGGRAYHILQGLWYRTMVDVRLIELEKATQHCVTNDERIQILEAVTGLKLRNFLASLRKMAAQ
tara:strand:- start:5576 stop:6526 length:951 start_codon:yes stop_codon:yes gene_type:complete